MRKGPTGHKYITHHPKTPRFNVYVRKVWLGCHDTLQEALAARDAFLAIAAAGGDSVYRPPIGRDCSNHCAEIAQSHCDIQR